MSETPQSEISVYRRLVVDKRLPHGAFRVWHYLFSRKNGEGKCWPAVSTIATDLRAKPQSVCDWIDMLRGTGYLRVEKTGKNHHSRYLVLYGDGLGALPEWATPKDSGTTETGNAINHGTTETGNAIEPSHCPKGIVALPIGDLRTAQRGNGSKDQRSKDQEDDQKGPGIVIKMDGKAPDPKREDWHSLPLSTQLSRMMGSHEIANNWPTWERRMQTDPTRLGEAVDAMHVNDVEKTAFGNRGAYLERLWQKAKSK